MYVFKVEGMEAKNGLTYPMNEASKPLTSGQLFGVMFTFTQWSVELKEEHFKNVNYFILK